MNRHAKRRILLLACLVGLSTPALAAPSPRAVDPTRSGESLAQQTCMQCHGNGHKVAPDLARQKLDYATLRYIVRHGLNAMPSFRQSELSDGELRAILQYLNAQRGKISSPKEH